MCLIYLDFCQVGGDQLDLEDLCSKDQWCILDLMEDVVSEIISSIL